jgi:hypothetical protein
MISLQQYQPSKSPDSGQRHTQEKVFGFHFTVLKNVLYVLRNDTILP